MVFSRKVHGRPLRTGATLLELLVVLGITGIIIAIALPAVLFAREAARRSQCSARRRDLGFSVHQFVDAHNEFPKGFGGGNFSFHSRLLPFLQESKIYDAINFAAGIHDEENQGNSTQFTKVMQAFLCPSLPGSRVVERPRPEPSFPLFGIDFDGPVPGLAYPGVMGVGQRRNGANDQGVLSLYSKHIKFADVLDGASKTALIGEWIPSVEGVERLRWQFPLTGKFSDESTFFRACDESAVGPDAPFQRVGRSWIGLGFAAYDHFLKPNSRDCIGNYTSFDCAGSLHSGGVNILRVDGSVTFVGDSIDLQIWRAFATIRGNEITSNL